MFALFFFPRKLFFKTKIQCKTPEEKKNHNWTNFFYVFTMRKILILLPLKGIMCRIFTKYLTTNRITYVLHIIVTMKGLTEASLIISPPFASEDSASSSCQ